MRRRHDPGMGSMPPEALLAEYPPPMREVATWLRGVVRRALPSASERVRVGWRIIGIDVPVGPRRSAYVAWIMVEARHVHLGFPQGVLLADADRRLEGAGITKRARWTTLTRRGEVPAPMLGGLLREAVELATLSPGERIARAMAREEDLRPPSP